MVIETFRVKFNSPLLQQNIMVVESVVLHYNFQFNITGLYTTSVCTFIDRLSLFLKGRVLIVASKTRAVGRRSLLCSLQNSCKPL